MIWYKSIDWMINWIGLVFLFICIGLVYLNVERPSLSIWQNNPLDAWNQGSLGIPILFILMSFACAVALIISQKNENNKIFQWKKFLIGFSFVFIIATLSKWISEQETMHKNHLSDSIWAIFFGFSFYQINKVFAPSIILCLDLAKQTELYIATSLVLLVENYKNLISIMGCSIFIAWIDTTVLFLFFSYICVNIFKLRPKQSMILSGCTLICGSSAATAIRNSLKGQEKDQKDLILISSLLTIPCIILLPMAAVTLNLSDDIAGSWFGGSVDSTGGVYATAEQFSDQSVTPAAVVKMIQNILIAPFSVCLVAFYMKFQEKIDELEIQNKKAQKSDQILQISLQNQTQNSETYPSSDQKRQSDSQEYPIKQQQNQNNEQMITQQNSKKAITNNQKEQQSYLMLIWDKFPKFVLGFVISIIIFNLTVENDKLEQGRYFIFTVSEWFSTCSFISIGMSLQLSQGDGKQLIILTGIYIVIQITDILVTLGMSYLAYNLFQT